MRAYRMLVPAVMLAIATPAVAAQNDASRHVRRGWQADARWSPTSSATHINAP